MEIVEKDETEAERAAGHGRAAQQPGGPNYSPLQVSPSPAYPLRQVHVKSPGVLSQSASSLQPPLFTEHSSISVDQQTDLQNKLIHGRPHIKANGVSWSYSPRNSTHYLVLYPQNGDRIVTIDSVTLLHPK